jgi:hypothetical protein
MKITMYELLGLVKDGKAPKKIRYNDNIYYSSKDRVDLHVYQTEESDTTRKLSLIIDNEYLNLNDYVEIIEEDKKMEKIDIDNDKMTLNGYETIPTQLFEVARKVNELIDEVNKLKGGKL